MSSTPRGPLGRSIRFLADFEPIVEVDLSEALTTADLDYDAPVRRYRGGPIYPNLVQSSGSELSAEHGRYLVDVLVEWARAPTHRRLKPSQVSHAPRRRNRESSLGPVSIPDDDGTPDQVADSLSRTRTARPRTRRLASWSVTTLRCRRSFLSRDVFLGSRHGSRETIRAARAMMMELAELDNVVTELPRQFDEGTNDTIRHIDVMWLRRNRIEAAFEVEHTTAIYSGAFAWRTCSRFNPTSTSRCIVVPDDRLDKALAQIERPVFQQMTRPLPRSCGVLTASSVDNELLRDARKFKDSLRPDVVQRYAQHVE